MSKQSLTELFKTFPTWKRYILFIQGLITIIWSVIGFPLFCIVVSILTKSWTLIFVLLFVLVMDIYKHVSMIRAGAKPMLGKYELKNNEK